MNSKMKLKTVVKTYVLPSLLQIKMDDTNMNINEKRWICFYALTFFNLQDEIETYYYEKQ